MDPSFVRTTREYLRNANIKSVEDGIKRSLDEAIERATKNKGNTIDVNGSTNSFMQPTFSPSMTTGSKVKGADMGAARFRHVSHKSAK